MANSMKTNGFGAIESSDEVDSSPLRSECTYILVLLTTRHNITRAKLLLRLLPVSDHLDFICHQTQAGAFGTSNDYARNIYTHH